MIKNKFYKNVFWTFLSTTLPLIIALFSIPILIKTLGTAKFGILSIAWVIIGYFSLFDFGLSRSITKLIAEKADKDINEEIPQIVSTALFLMTVLGIIGGGIALLTSPWIVSNIIKIPNELIIEVLNTFKLLSLSIPIVIISSGLKGILEGFQDFKSSSLIKLALGISTFIVPFIVIFFTNSLVIIVFFLLIFRLFFLFIYWYICWSNFKPIKKISKSLINIRTTKKLFSFGLWMTISNIVGPLLLYLGQFFLVSLVSADAVSYFSIPYEIIIKLLIIPTILVTVLFPDFVKLSNISPQTAYKLYSKSMKYLTIIILPLVIIIILFSKIGLSLWINPIFALYSNYVTQILAIGIFINSFGHISQAFIQALGRPDITAKLHLIELFLYIPYCLFLTKLYGIEGAAISWLLRAMLSTFTLHYLSKLTYNEKLKIKN